MQLDNSVTHVPACSEGERDLIDAVLAALGPGASERRASFAAEVVERKLRFLKKAHSAPKLVVFASDVRVAASIAERLRGRLEEAVFEGSDAACARKFEAHVGPAVAVFGREGEEGLNLHFADAIVHADLPFSVTRIEQRIGRLDRFGRNKGPIQHLIISPAADDDTPWSAWFKLLCDGFKIFDRPASDIQFALEDRIEFRLNGASQQRRDLIRGQRF